MTVRDLQFMEDGEYRAEIHYILHLHRRPIYYITVIVAPTFLISALSILGIFSPGDNDGPRGEKVSLGKFVLSIRFIYCLKVLGLSWRWLFCLISLPQPCPNVGYHFKLLV